MLNCFQTYCFILLHIDGFFYLLWALSTLVLQSSGSVCVYNHMSVMEVRSDPLWLLNTDFIPV